MASSDPEKINTEQNTNEKPVEIIPGFATIEDFTKDGFKTLVEATRNSNSLPQDRDWDFYSTHPSFGNLMNKQGDDILHLINDILKEQNVHGNIRNRDLQEKIELIVEANDTILERVANNLDELAGINKNPELSVEIQTVSAHVPVNGSWNKLNNATYTVSSKLTPTKSSVVPSPHAIRLLTGKNIQRPQVSFKDKIDNSHHPWEPRIKDKPNSIKPLAIFLEETEDGIGEVFSHPYEFELDRFEPSAEQLTYMPVVKPKPLAETPLREVTTVEELDAMVEDLRKYQEIAVDLEHHSYRTFMGITCLMQISTSDTDYIIDTLALRDKLHVLNEVFTKSSIVKVFHGADHDIEWLQRDLSLYIVNMFDTYQAAKQLSYAQLSLAYLLRKFCQIDANKHFQLADWRIRPLPEELKTYAREDTHYLLYIYHMMRNELLDVGNKGTNILKSVIQASTNVCKRRYVKPVLHANSHMDLYRKCKKLFDNRQMYALKHVYKWRDELARAEDESTGFVLPNHMMLQIAELLPREMQGVLACCNPIPPLVRANLLEIHKIILRAREQSVVKPILSEETRSRGSTQHATKLNFDNVLHCPHDLPKAEEFRDDLPTLLGDRTKHSEVNAVTEQLVQHKPALSVFQSPDNSDTETPDQAIVASVRQKMKKIKFLGPYERYKLVKTYVQAEEEKEQLQADKQKQQPNDNRTDEDRISALHKHFIHVSNTVPQIQPDSTTASDTHNVETSKHMALSEMKGRKRKRAMFEEEHASTHGGAGSAHRPKDVRSNFKSRGQKNRNIGKNNNRSSTFGSTGGRGRGGGPRGGR
ncbi:Rrp6 [Carabus blaptoides fortunei]